MTHSVPMMVPVVGIVTNSLPVTVTTGMGNRVNHPAVEEIDTEFIPIVTIVVGSMTSSVSVMTAAVGMVGIMAKPVAVMAPVV